MLTDNSNVIRFAAYSFSLLLNVTELATMSEYFKCICYMFLSDTCNPHSLESFNKIQSLIHLRPKLADDIKEILKLDLTEYDFYTDELKQFPIAIQDTINGQSPFSNYFQIIFNEIISNLNKVESNLYEKNPIVCKQFVEDLLLDKYLPYCFIWFGFVMKNIIDEQNDWTRANNGGIENIFYTRKQKGRDFKKFVTIEIYKFNIQGNRWYVYRFYGSHRKF